MKKLTSAFLTLALLSSLSACSGDNLVEEDNRPAVGEAGAEIGDVVGDYDAVFSEMELEQRLSAAYEALDAAYSSGDEAAIAEAEIAVQEAQDAFENFMEQMDPGEYNGGGNDEYEVPEDEYFDWDDGYDDWDDAFAVDEILDERLFDVDWYHISEDVRTYHIKLYGYGEYQKNASFSVYDPRTDTTESYGFPVSEGYMDDPNDPSVSIVYVAVNPLYDTHTGGSYADEVWHLEYINGDMELKRYTVGEHGYAGDYIDSMLFTTTTPG